MPKKCLSASQWFRISLKTFFILLFSAYLPVHAAVTGTWIAPGPNKDWNVATNWSSNPIVPGTDPAPFDSAIIGTGSSVSPLIINLGDNFTLDTLTYNDASSSTHNISSSGSLTLAGTGIVVTGGIGLTQTITNNLVGTLFFKNNAGGNGSNIRISNRSVVTFQDNSTLGNLQIINVSNGIVNFQNNSSGGNGNISNNNPTSVVNFEDNSSASNANISQTGGTLNFQDSSSPANATISVDSNSVVNFNNTSPSTVYSGVISGSGPLNVNLGSPSDVLTFLSANSSFGGLTTINSGTFALGTPTNSTASVGGNVNVNPGGTLAGYGTVNGNVNNSGTVAPGTEPLSLGALTINTNYNQTASGKYVAGISQSGDNDLLIVGSAALDGELSIIDYPYGFKPGNVYVILGADGAVNGTFSGLDINGVPPGSFVTPIVTYVHSPFGDEVDFEMSFDPIAFERAALTPNQISVADYILLTGGTPGVQALISTLTTDGQFQAAMDQISGATYANQTMALAHVGSWFEHELANRLMAFPSASDPCCMCPNGQLKYRNNNQAPGGWVSVYGGQDDINAGQVSGLMTNTEGVALGYEWPMNCQTKLGLGVGYTHFRGHATDREVASDNGNLLQAGIYGRYERCGWLFGAAADIGTTNNLNTERHVQGAMAVFSPRSDYRANVISEQVIATYDLLQSKRCWKLRPFVGFIDQQVNSDGFTEEGNSGFELNVGSNDYHSARSQLGVLWEAPMTECVRPFASVDWEHEFADRNGSFDASLVGLPTPPTFHIVGQEIGRDSAAVKAGLNLVRQGRFNLAVLYQGQFASGWQQNGAALEAGFRFD